MRYRHLAAGAAMLVTLLACSGVFEPVCGCTLAPPMVAVYGTVTGPDAAPVAGARVAGERRPANCAAGQSVVFETQAADASGRYRLPLPLSEARAATAVCLMVRAEAPQGSTLTASEAVRVTFPAGVREADSVRVDLALRPPFTPDRP